MVSATNHRRFRLWVPMTNLGDEVVQTVSGLSWFEDEGHAADRAHGAPCGGECKNAVRGTCRFRLHPKVPPSEPKKHDCSEAFAPMHPPLS